MARRFGRSRFSRGPRKAVDWSASAGLAAPVSVPAASAVLLEIFTPIMGGETVIRTRGMLGWLSDQATVDEEQFGAFGIAVVSEQAATVGATAVPHPVTDAAWGGWLYHTYFFSKLEFADATGVNPNIMHTMAIDSKAMRKVDEGDRLITVVENIHATHGFRFANNERFLSKVH